MYIPGCNAFYRERNLIHRFKKYRYIGEKVFSDTENTEIFTKDILGKDNKVY